MDWVPGAIAVIWLGGLTLAVVAQQVVISELCKSDKLNKKSLSVLTARVYGRENVDLRIDSTLDVKGVELV